MAKLKRKKSKRTLFGILIFLIIAYNFCMLSNIQFIKYWRNVWIETAETTMTHQWLNSFFIPEEIVDKVMDNKIGAIDKDGDLVKIAGDFETPKDTSDPLGQKKLKVGSKDSNGASVIVNDKDQGILITEIKTDSYCAKVMQVFDPSRVYVGFTKYRGERGMILTDYLKKYDAIAAVNASGFYDPNGQGMGGEVVGYSIAQGEEWGMYSSEYDSICFTSENKLVVGPITPENKNKNSIRDGIQFGPVLVNNGEKNVKGTAGYGLQPRTAIGQKKDGTVIFITCDGRQAGYSIGMDISTLADLMIKYDAEVAALCDGGSSTVMGYNGKLITKPCGGDRVNGRPLPDAFLIRRK